MKFFEQQHLDHHGRGDRDAASAGDRLANAKRVEETLDLARVRPPIRAEPFGKLNRKREVFVRWLDGEVVEVMQQWRLVSVASGTDVLREGMQVRLLHRTASDQEADVGLRIGGGQTR